MTFNDNVAPSASSIDLYADNSHVRGSILASDGPNCGGWQPSGGVGNIIIDASCIALTAPQNLIGVDPLLGPLAANGGPTLTHSPLPGSPAIDFFATAAVWPDQRGVSRPFGAASDAGAVEVSGSAPFATTVTLTASPNPLVAGGIVTLTARVSHDGLVTFRANGTMIGQSEGTTWTPATLPVASLSPGKYTMTATFEGDAGHAPSISSPVTVVVVASASSLLAVPALNGVGLIAMTILVAAAGLYVARL